MLQGIELPVLNNVSHGSETPPSCAIGMSCQEQLQLEREMVLVSKVSGFTELVTGRHANDGTRQVPASGLNHCVTEVNFFFYMEVTSICMRVPG